MAMILLKESWPLFCKDVEIVAKQGMFVMQSRISEVREKRCDYMDEDCKMLQ